jgi:hypothetical protein
VLDRHIEQIGRATGRDAASTADLFVPGKDILMQIYMFTSQSTANLRAFAGDAAGSKLPPRHGPWNADGTIRSGEHPPHRFSRAKIEQAIKFDGFQLWRMKPEDTKPAADARTQAA